MSIFKKFALPLTAVALVAVMGVSLLTNTRTAYAAATLPIMTVPALTPPTPATILANNAGAPTITAGVYSLLGVGGTAGTASTIAIAAGADAGTAVGVAPVLTENAIGDFGIAAKTMIFALPAGFQYTTTGTCTITVANAGTGPNCKMSLNSTATKMTLTIGGGVADAVSVGAPAVYTVAGTKVRVTGNVLPTTTTYITLDATSTNTVPLVTLVNNTLNTAIPGTKTYDPAPAGFGGYNIGTIAAPTAYAAAAAPYTILLQMVKDTAACGTSNPVSLAGVPTVAGDATAPDVLADGSQTFKLCATVMGASGAPVPNAPVNFTVSSGIVSTGTGKTVQAPTNAAGNATTDYRGGGNVTGTDTAIAAITSLNAVGTRSIDMVAAGGTTASKLLLNAPSILAIAPVITNVSPQYSSANIGTDMVAQVADASGLGVNTQVVLLSVDRGALVDNPVFAGGTANVVCAGVTAKSITITTAGTNLAARAGAATPGTVNFAYCGNQLDAGGKATITAQNISTTMANATTTLTMAGRPAKIEATASGNSISAKVSDANGNPVADGTPIRFTISPNAGAVSTACTLSTNGAATAVVALTTPTGTVIVSSDWNEGGSIATASTCAAAGTQQVAASVAVPGGTGTGGTTPPATVTPPAAAGPGTFAAAPVFSASKLAQSVFNGGTVAQLETAITGAKGSGAWAQDAKGVFNLYIVNGGFVNDGFKAAFPAGLGVIALTVVGS